MSKKITDFSQLIDALDKSKTEEDVKSIYATIFALKYDTSDRHDLYTPQVLFEFKYEQNFENVKVSAKVLAQMLYYVRRLKYGMTDKPIPLYLCLADKSQVILTETIAWKFFYTNDKYDWDLAPSNPDMLLVNEIAGNELFKNLKVFKITEKQEFEIFVERITKILQDFESLTSLDKKIITESNFEEVFEYWNGIFGDSVRNGLKTSRYFVCDIQEGRTFYIKDQSKVVFQFGGDEARTKKILAKDYEYFWSIYERVTNADTIRGILAKIDRLTDETMRRFHGEFFTPVLFAKKALDYLEKVVGKEWWKTGEYRLWDMAAGTGNLEYYLPTDALPSCYLSTLYKEDAEHCQRLFPQANIFQYDYLNDDVANVFLNGNALPFDITWKLPEKLRKDLRNPQIKWIILINPPFGTSSLAGTDATNKAGASDTLIRKKMHEQGLGETSRELFVQFLFRIKKEFKNKIAHLCLFANIKYLNANNDQKFRDEIFQYAFESGFVFSSANFSGTSKSSAFPVCTIIWDLTKSNKIEEQTIELDVFDEEVEKIGVKKVSVIHRDKFLNKWINRPKTNRIFPSFSGGITIKEQTKDVRNRVSENFLASFMCVGNDFQHQNFTAFLSGPYVSAGALSVTPENFEKAMVIHAVRKLPKMDWLNNKDIFMQPTKELSQEFMNDCTVWNLFSTSNQTVALRDVIYQKEIYQIDNHFFPLLKEEIKHWKMTDSDIVSSLSVGEDRFVAKYLKDLALSEEAKAILAISKEIWQFYFTNLNKLNTTKFKIATWDAGWWQVRNALTDQNLAVNLLEELKQKHNTLKNKLLPQIYDFGFLNG